MRARLLPVLLLVGGAAQVLPGGTAEGATPLRPGSVWRRAVPGGNREFELRAALDRAAAGYAEERDLLRIRTALVEAGRGQGPRDPGNVVLLVHFRVELALLGPAGASHVGPRLARLLHEALQKTLPPELRALGFFELARLARADAVPGAELWIDQALEYVVDEQQRARLLFLRGLIRLEGARQDVLAAPLAEEDFRAARELGGSARLGAACLLGTALGARLRGASSEADLAAKSATFVWDSVNSASGASLGAVLSLLPAEEEAFLAELARGRTLAQRELTGEVTEPE